MVRIFADLQTTITQSVPSTHTVGYCLLLSKMKVYQRKGLFDLDIKNILLFVAQEKPTALLQKETTRLT